MDNRGSAEILHWIVGIMLVLAGMMYIFNNGTWGLVIASIGLLIEAVKNVLK